MSEHDSSLDLIQTLVLNIRQTYQCPDDVISSTFVTAADMRDDDDGDDDKMR